MDNKSTTEKTFHEFYKKYLFNKVSGVCIFLLITILVEMVVKPRLIHAAPQNSSQPKESLKTQVIVDASKSLGNMPEIFKAGTFMLHENFTPDGGTRYLHQKYFSEQLPGMTTIFVPLWAANNFDEFKKKVEVEGLLKRIIDEAKEIISGGGRVLFDLSVMPRWLSSNLVKGEYWRYPPKDYNQWKELVAYTVGYLYKNGIKGADYRIWEEADTGITEKLKFWNAAKEEFYRLYKYSVEGIKSVDPEARITFGNANLFSDVLQGMIQYVGKNNLPLDYIIYHPFLSPPFPTTYKNHHNNIRDWLERARLDNDIPVHTESWNSWLEFGKPNLPNGQPDERSSERDTEYSAVYAIQTLFSQDAGGVTHHSFFSRIDPFYGRYLEAGLIKNNQQFYGDWGMFTRNLIIKPVYNAFRALSILSGKQENQTPTRLQATFDEYDLIATIASQSKDRSKVRVLLSNFTLATPDLVKKYSKYTAKKHIKEHYGAELKPFETCLKEGNPRKECISQLPHDLRPFLRCIAQGKGEKCSPLMPDHLREFNRKTIEYTQHIKKNPREVILSLNNLPFQGKATLTTYTIDKHHSNSCRYNKRTEPKPTQTECGINGAIDEMVKQARKEAKEKAIKTVKKHPSLKPKIKEIGESLFYYGKYTTPDGETMRNSIWIDKINNDPDVSLEGSQQTKDITINKKGSYKELIVMQPNSVVLIEISKVRSP